MPSRPGANNDIEANVSEKTGLFALVLVRRGLDDTARWIFREQWVQHNKLIVGIHDEGYAPDGRDQAGR
jgi:hypothetical protein